VKLVPYLIRERESRKNLSLDGFILKVHPEGRGKGEGEMKNPLIPFGKFRAGLILSRKGRGNV
jgi:hypothetical protein